MPPASEACVTPSHVTGSVRQSTRQLVARLSRVLLNRAPTDRGCRCALPPYSLTGVIHRLREGSLQSPPQQTVNNSVENHKFDLFWSGCRTDITPVRSTNFSRPPTASRPLALRICTLSCRRSIRLALYELQPALLWSPTTYANENRYPS